MESCDSLGDTYDILGGYLECRFIHGHNLQWVHIDSIKPIVKNPSSPSGIEPCKLQNSDAVTQSGRDAGAGLAGFPMNRTTKNGMNPKGINNVLMVGVDFPELRGGDNLAKIMDEDKTAYLDWFNYFSHSVATFNVSSVNEWIHAPLSAISYVRTGNDGNSTDHNRFLADAAQPFIDLISEKVDLRKFTTVYMIFPEGEIHFDMDLIIRNETFNTKEGQTRLNFFGWGHDLEMQKAKHWAFFIHETLHDFDIIGHAPLNGSPFGIMTAQDGISMAMNPYEQFLLDWLPSDQIYCQNIETLTKSVVALSPVERADGATKMAIIRLTSTKAIVIESHGIDKWSSVYDNRRFPPGFYAVVAYIVDLNKAVAPPVSADSRSLSNEDYAWAVFQKVEGASTVRYPDFPRASNINFQDLAVLGDSFLIEGVKIKFVGTGNYDTVEISKA